MNRVFLTLWSVAFLLFIAGCMNEEEALTPEEAGETVLDLLQNREYETIVDDWFNEESEIPLTREDLAAEWEARTAEGEAVEIHSLEAESRTEETDVVEAVLTSSILQFDVRMIFNDKRELIGFNLSQGVALAEMPGGVTEEKITVGEGTEWELEGLLTLPPDAEDVPAVILVHGSGPADRDETAFAYKPFRDIAWGLAVEGIAVIRYDKRTFTYGAELAQKEENITVYKETVEDALRATELAKQDPRIDAEQVYLVGHSLGGMLAPRIEAAGGDYAGIVSLAGSPRPLWEIIYDQNLMLIERQLTDEEEIDQQLSLVEGEYERAQKLAELSEEETQDTRVFGINGYYFKEMDEYPVPELVGGIEKPMLILQGEDDFQVFYEKDFEAWKDLLADRENVTFISYPGLNHFFVEYQGPGEGTLEEYEVAGIVDSEVIKDIGKWILN